VKLDLYRDVDGSPRARGERAGDGLAGYLASELQGSVTSTVRLLDLLDRLEAGEMERWEETGNAYTLTLTPAGATIVAEWSEEAAPELVTLADLRAGLSRWLELLGGRR
jgi:hypothetical protein